jgi:acetyl-CoA C-acetyltransferase
MHAIAEMVARCRRAPGARGLVFANGGYLTRHSFGVWSTAPRAFERVDPATYQREVDSIAAPILDERPDGAGVIETFTVVHDGGDPMFAILIGRTDGGRRFLARLHEGAGSLIDVPVIGRPVRVRPGDGGPNLAALAGTA